MKTIKLSESISTIDMLHCLKTILDTDKVLLEIAIEQKENHSAGWDQHVGSGAHFLPANKGYTMDIDKRYQEKAATPLHHYSCLKLELC